MAFLSYVSGHMNLLSKDAFPLLPTKFENAATPSLIRIKFRLRFRLRYSGIKTIRRHTVKMFLKQSRWHSRWVLAGLRRQLSEYNSLTSNYSPHWLHFGPMREMTIEEMCDCAFLRVHMHMYVPVASHLTASTELLSGLGCGFSAFSVHATVAQLYLLNEPPESQPGVLSFM